MPFTLNVNGKTTTVDVPGDMPLLWVLRDVMNLKGTKFGCGIGQCGACTVHVRGRAQRACQTPYRLRPVRRITTIEGLSPDGSHPLQQAWQEIDVPQCGYCQAGQIMSAAALLATTPQPTDAADQHRDERQPLPLRHLHADSRGHSPRGVTRDVTLHFDGAGRRRRVGGAMTKNLLTRRSFLQVSVAAGGGMLIALHLDPVELLAQGPPGAPAVRYDALAFVKIAADGT